MPDLHGVTVISVAHFAPAAVGHGGNHRAYQIQHDLAAAVGTENIVRILWPEWYIAAGIQSVEPGPPPAHNNLQVVRRVARQIAPLRWLVHLWRKTGIRPRLRRARERVPYLTVEHPIDLISDHTDVTQRYCSPEFVAYYMKVVAQIRRPAICIIEDPGFSGLLGVNKQLGIPTIACTHNIEAFDATLPFNLAQTQQILFAGLGFAKEFQVLAHCDARLLISKVEVAVVGGLGASSSYYPYMPVGQIRASMMNVRSRRESDVIEPGLFLLMGSAAHTTTGWAFRWFLEQIAANGVPDGIRIVVCGPGTESILPSHMIIPNLDVRGWVEQGALEDLLCRARAVLVPQSLGFGALTKLPELSLAGIPVIVSQHASYALDLPPGICGVEDRWEEWEQAMVDLVEQKQLSAKGAYSQWEGSQPNPLRETLKHLSMTSKPSPQSPLT